MEWSVVIESAPALFRGLSHTLGLCAIAALTSLALGALVAAARLQRHPWLSRIAEAYTAICLGLPLLIVIFILFYLLPEYGLTIDPYSVGILSLTIYYAPYIGQIMVAAIKTVSQGQQDAAKALGLPFLRSVRRVWLPQALPTMLPPMTGLLIGLVKDSALLAMVSVPEFMFEARQAVSETYAPLEIYFTVALTYWLLSLTAEMLSGYLERRLTRHRRPSPIQAQA